MIGFITCLLVYSLGIKLSLDFGMTTIPAIFWPVVAAGIVVAAFLDLVDYVVKYLKNNH